MSAIGNNLLLQWYQQNQRSYAPGMTLWIEADSFGKTIYKNKAPNATYNLNVVGTRYGKVIGKAIDCGSSQTRYMRLTADVNVIGPGSFTIESVVRPDPPGTSARFLITQRPEAASVVPAGRMQLTCPGSTGYLGVYAYNPDGVNVALDMTGDNTMLLDTVNPQYIAFGYDANTGLMWKRCNELYAYKENVDYSCNVDKCSIAYALFTGSNSFVGSLYSFRVWQRSLAPDECMNNYGIDRIRFNF